MATKQKRCIVQVCVTFDWIFHTEQSICQSNWAGEGRSENSTDAAAVVKGYESGHVCRESQCLSEAT